MYLIKTCPTCRTRLRFPIDKGIIKVKCTCGFNFIANPDNTDIYQNASFDLSRTTGTLKKMAPFTRAINNIHFDHMLDAVINKILNIKYKIQNFRLLPNAEKKKILLTILISCAGLIGLITAIYLITRFSHASGKIII